MALNINNFFFYIIFGKNIIKGKMKENFDDEKKYLSPSISRASSISSLSHRLLQADLMVPGVRP